MASTVNCFLHGPSIYIATCAVSFASFRQNACFYVLFYGQVGEVFHSAVLFWMALRYVECTLALPSFRLYPPAQSVFL